MFEANGNKVIGKNSDNIINKIIKNLLKFKNIQKLSKIKSQIFKKIYLSKFQNL